MGKIADYFRLVEATDDSLALHDEKEHDGHYDPKTMSCKLREREKRNILADDILKRCIEPKTPNDLKKMIQASLVTDVSKTQMLEILDAYTNYDGTFKKGFRKAPNGMRSNLNAFQWLQVRTDLFRSNFFGDWLSLCRNTKLNNSKPVSIDPSYGIQYDKNNRNQIKKDLVQWAKDSGFGGTYETDVGDVQIDFHSVKTSFGHPRWTEEKLHAIYTLPEGFANAVYVGSKRDLVHGNIKNHYFSYRAMYGGKPMVVYCRAQEDVNKNRLYLHEIYTEDEMKKSGTVLPGALKETLTDSAAFGKIILNALYSVNPDDVSKIIDENGEPKVVYHGTNSDFRKFERATDAFSTRLRDLTGDQGKKAFFFTSKKQAAATYGDNLKEVFLNCKCPIVYSNEQHDDSEWQAMHEYWLSQYQDNSYQTEAGRRIREIVRRYSDNDEWSEEDQKEYEKLCQRDQEEKLKAYFEERELPRRFDSRIDGFIGKSILDIAENRLIYADVFAVMDSRQIKSATANNGEFSASEDTER